MYESQNSEKFEMFNIFKAFIVMLCVLLVYNHYNLETPEIVQIRDPKFTLLGPYNNTRYELKDEYDQLIDIKNFTFNINPQPCKDYPNGLLLLVIVSSKPDHFEKRATIRETWGRTTDTTKVLFLLGLTDNTTILNRVINESLNQADIVLGSFTDAYRNMTYKHVMGLKWVSHHCPTAKYVLKTDDDVAVNSHELRKFLAKELSPWGAKDMIMCKLFVKAEVQRGERSKWYVSYKEFEEKYYPTYCAGMVILYSQDVVPRLLATAQSIPYFWIDDVHITGVIAEINGIARTSLYSLVLSDIRMYRLTHKVKNVGKFLFGPKDLSTTQILDIWKSIPEN